MNSTQPISKTHTAIMESYPAAHLRYRLQRLIHSQRLRKRIGASIARKMPSMPAQYAGCNDCESMVEQLWRDGVSEIPPLLESKEINELLEFVANCQFSHPYMRSLGYFSLKERPGGANIAYCDDEAVMRAPHVMPLALSGPVLCLAAAYLGCIPMLSRVSLWYSFPSEHAKFSQNFHRDYDDFAFVKFFIYLNDVGLENGPHEFLVGSHRSSELNTIKRMHDREVSSAFGGQGMVLTGNKGKSFMEDTSGVHRGHVVSRGYRVVLQLEYTLLPIGARKNRIKWDPAFKLDEVQKHVARGYLMG